MYPTSVTRSPTPPRINVKQALLLSSLLQIKTCLFSPLNMRHPPICANLLNTKDNQRSSNPKFNRNQGRLCQTQPRQPAHPNKLNSLKSSFQVPLLLTVLLKETQYRKCLSLKDPLSLNNCKKGKSRKKSL